MKQQTPVDDENQIYELQQLFIQLMEEKKDYSIYNEIIFYLEAGLIQEGSDYLIHHVGQQQFQQKYQKLINKIYKNQTNKEQKQTKNQNDKSFKETKGKNKQTNYGLQTNFKRVPQTQKPLINKKKLPQLKESSNHAKKPSLMSKGEEMLRKICQTDKNYIEAKQKIDSMALLQDMIVCISEFTGKKNAETIAKILYQEQNKANIKVNMLDRLYSQCAKENFSDERIQKIKFLARQGKRKAVYRELIAQCGQAKGKKLFEMAEDDIPYKPPQPISGTIKIKQKNGIEIRKYDSQVAKFDKQQAKNVLVLGQTGCGKSTFINSLVNYLLRVEIDDPFRYYLIVENQENQMNSITQTITDYYIKDSMSGDVYRFIDTPGFGDTKGLQNDQKIVQMITNKFKTDLDTIHCVLFVMKSSNTRVGVYQKYVFDSVMDLFDKTIAPNFAFIFTFSDSGVPPVLEHVKETEKGFGKYWSQIVVPKFIKVNSCGIFQKIDPQDKINMGYWEISNQSIKSLFKKINSIQAKSMNLSKELINKKQNLLNQIKTTFQTLQRSISNRQNVKKFIDLIITYAKQMDANKSFQQEIDQAYWQQVTYTGNVTRCMSSQTCMRKNCHKGCVYSNGPDKIKCIAMTNGYCTICGCQWSAHINHNKIFQQRTRKKKVTDQTLKHMYQKNKASKSLSEAALADKFIQFQAEARVIAESTQRMLKLQNQLSMIQMSDKKPESTRAYVDYLIKEEYRSQKPGYTEKIKKLSATMKQLQLHEKIIRGTWDEQQKTKTFVNQMKTRYAQEMRSRVEPSVWQKFKGLFS